MKLDVLTRGDMTEPARVARSHAGKGAHLRRGDDPLRRLDAHHLDAVLPLAVRAAHETEAPPLIRRHLAALELPQRLDELVDVVLAGKIQVRTPYRLRIIDHGHTSPRCSPLLRPALPEHA